MSCPLVTVIIPVYNDEEYLAEAIQSAIGQTYKPLEIIVINDGSTDESEKIAKKYLNHIKYIYKKNSGISNTWNTGIKLSQGSLISFLDSDDIWLPHKLERQVSMMIQNPFIQYSVTKILHFLEQGTLKPKSFRNELLDNEVIGYLMSTTVVKKEIFNKYGMFDEELKNIAGDTEFFSRLRDNNVNLGIVDETLVRKRIHNSNISSVSREFNKNLLSAVRKSIKRKQKRSE